MTTIHYQGEYGGCIPINTDPRLQTVNHNRSYNQSKPPIKTTQIPIHGTTDQRAHLPRDQQIPNSLDTIRFNPHN